MTVILASNNKEENSMNYKNIFERYELKYLLTPKQKDAIFSGMQNYMQGDQYQNSTICNIYFDTPDFLLIRRSLEKPLYKEKLRMRSYGISKPDSTIFVELKKKYKSVVYKRRTSMTQSQAEHYLCKGYSLKHSSQITREIDYFCDFYQNLQPTVFLSYQREAFSGIYEEDLRITFDENILWRQEQLSLCTGIYGTAILPPGTTLMEIKTAGAMPLWLTKILSEHHIYKTSFSKYGKAYEAILQARLHHTGGLCYA